MSLSEAYSFLFADIFMEMLILPLHGQVAFTAMKIFGGYDMVLIILLSSLAAFVASLVNFLFGYMFILAATRFKYNPENTDFISKLVSFLRGKGIYLLVITPIPFFGAIIAILMGFASVRYKSFAILVLPATIIYYIFKASF